jgi:hypothetical protein
MSAARLDSLPDCPIWQIDTLAKAAGYEAHMIVGQGGAELAAITEVGAETWTHTPYRRGFAALAADGTFFARVGDETELKRIYSSALRHIGWKGSEFTCRVYGGAS